jgi:hypothetical protein
VIADIRIYNDKGALIEQVRVNMQETTKHAWSPPILENGVLWEGFKFRAHFRPRERGSMIND